MVPGLLSSLNPQDGSSTSIKHKPFHPTPTPHPRMATQLLLVSIGEISLFHCCDSPTMATVLSGLPPWHRSVSSLVLFSLKFMPSSTSGNLDKFSSSQKPLLILFHDCERFGCSPEGVLGWLPSLGGLIWFW